MPSSVMTWSKWTNKTSEGGIAPSNQTVGSLLRSPLPAKPARKMNAMNKLFYYLFLGGKMFLNLNKHLILD